MKSTSVTETICGNYQAVFSNLDQALKEIRQAKVALSMGVLSGKIRVTDAVLRRYEDILIESEHSVGVCRSWMRQQANRELRR